MSNQEDIFRITYSYYLNEMQSVLLDRIDKLISFLLIVLGSSVMASGFNLFITGLFIASLSAFQFIYQPGKASYLANSRAKQYLSLKINAESQKLNDEEVHKQLSDLLQSDISTFGTLCNPAFKRASIQLKLEDDTELSKPESFVAWVAGDLPISQRN
ncbi:TPA: hypothetical protein ACXNIR_003811 [Proteus mirabilis]|uniref:hypothetical protein n=1 Tax=Proteus TaxID=583 RepID=UPI0008A561F8|nr:MULTISPECIES: hypothetical protein [Proteus]EKU8115294.1 hypothetical protein [Proteus mirabilis]MBG2968153.1 hypothetical protein [Proteus mirabilis]MBG2985463.1 hypothetical protein [Proteus mirabilis]MBI6265751.1 hypothetical protein [Proteus mirabilis]MDZ7489832.1 hypothetical protein [Proteus mirabilis]